MTGTSFMICHPQLLSEDGESPAEPLPSRVKSVRMQTGESEGELRGSPEQSGGPWGRDRGGLSEGRGEIDR